MRAVPTPAEHPFPLLHYSDRGLTLAGAVRARTRSGWSPRLPSPRSAFEPHRRLHRLAHEPVANLDEPFRNIGDEKTQRPGLLIPPL